MNSCIMLAVSLNTPIDLNSVIKEDDLKGDGIIQDSHITIIYGKEMRIPVDEVLPTVSESLGENEYSVFTEVLKDSFKFKVLNLFDLDVFEKDDYDYLILKLKKGNEIHDKLSKINNGLESKWNITSDFPEYNPHITLAELIPGSGRKYLSNNILLNVLGDSKVGLEDLVMSYGEDGGPFDKWNVTTYHAVERLFREK